MRCTLPFSLKLLWSPFVEIYHFKSFGRRKSWVIPTQLAMCAVFLYLKDNIETLLAEKHVNFTTAILTFLVVTMTCQDIAVDSWAVEMLHPANSSYGSSSQSMGITLGAFISSSVFIALNSPEFCQQWVYGAWWYAQVASPPAVDSEGLPEPVLTLQGFIFMWACFQAAVTAYIALCVSEVPIARQGEEGEDADGAIDETQVTLSQTFAIFRDVVSNKNLRIWFLFKLGTAAAQSIYDNVGGVYLTSDLGYDRENHAFAGVVTKPIDIALSFVIGYMASERPLRLLATNMLVGILTSTYAVLYMMAYFPPKEEQDHLTFLHVTLVDFLAKSNSTFAFVADFALIQMVTDKRLSGIHVTCLATVSNQASFFHKLYIFRLIDSFGIFIP